jgi:4-aminobutyrate aminotransferase
MGRTGRMLAAEHWDVQPDVVCLAKGLASGMPLGAFVARSEHMSWAPGSHGSTFGGNPVACAAALATLDLLEDGLIDNAREVGDHLLEGLRALRARHPEQVTDVRGLGLMAALQLDTPERAGDVVQRAFRRGLLLLTAGSRAVRLCPPLVISPSEADVGLEILGEAVADCAAAEQTAVRGSVH